MSSPVLIFGCGLTATGRGLGGAFLTLVSLGVSAKARTEPLGVPPGFFDNSIPNLRAAPMIEFLVNAGAFVSRVLFSSKAMSPAD